MRRALTDKGISALKPRPKRYAYPDPELRGHWVRVQPSGSKSFCAVTRSPNGKQTWTTIGAADSMSIVAAREAARQILQRVRAGLPPKEPRATTFAAVSDSWIKRHVAAKGLRSRDEIERLLRAHVLPLWSNREFTAIRRSDVAALLDEVEDGHSPRQADAVLTVVRSLMNWFATRHDDYVPPIVRGMRRQSPHAQARARILTDAEIRAIWKAAEGTYGGIVKLALLTAQRQAKVVRMRWSDISVDGEWIIPREPREKDNAGSLILPEVAVATIRAQNRLGDNPFVFAGRGSGAWSGLSKGKKRLDAASDVSGWRFHDLRRTARSLMSRAGVSSEHAERVMGHTIGGVEGVYNRHGYRDEKADALRRLAALIDTIVNPPAANVRPLRRAAR